MRRHLPPLQRAALALPFLCALAATRLSAQTPSASSTLVAQPIPDRTVPYGVADAGTVKSMLWGVDTAWPHEYNLRRAVAFMGINNVSLARLSFQPTVPLVNGDLQQQQIADLNYRLSLLSFTSPNTQVTLNCDHPSVDSWYLGNAARWAQLMDVTTRRVQAAGRTVVSIAPFNEPDYGWGQYTGSAQNGQTDFFNICGELRNNARFNAIRISGGNTLSNDAALPWYNALKTRLDEGNTHQLAGSFNNYATFYQTVRADGKYATGDELHNVGEAMVGAEYGMQAGIWWAAAELARGEFARASFGRRLAYTEHRPNWMAASVYRSPAGKVQLFSGGSERQAVTTTFCYLSKDRDVYYDGVGPQREFTLVMPGGTGYNNGQTNAERVVNVTWGEDIQPVIGGRYKLVNRSTGQVLQVAGSSTADGAGMQQGAYAGATSQQFDVTPVDARVGGDFSYFSVLAVHSGKALDDDNFTLDDGGRMQQWQNAVGVNQQRYLDYAEDGWFRIRSRHSTKCLDLSANGIDVVQQEKNLSSQSQQWRLLPLSAPIEFTAPSAPTSLVATANPESVRLSWTASPDADVAGYTIYRAESASGPFNTIARNVQGTSFVDNTATISGTYYYKLRAVDNSLNRSAYSSQVAATTTGAKDLVELLQFDGNKLDNSINLNHCATYGGATFGAGKTGTGALALNGTDAFVQLPATVANQDEITVATWVYWNGGNAWQRIFDFGNSATENMFLTSNSWSGNLQFSIVNGSAAQDVYGPVLPKNAWSHVALTIGATGIRMYLNGALVAQSNNAALRPLAFKPVQNYIGRSQYPDALFNGRVDDFRVYNYALTAAEIAALSSNITVTTWTGASSTDWYTAGNWTAGVPTATTDALVPAGTARNPVIASGTAVAHALTLTGTLNQTGGTLDLRGDFTNNGAFLPTGGTVSLGVADQAGEAGIAGSSATRFWNLSVQGSGAPLKTTAATSIRRLLTLTGSLVTQDNPCTLESDAAGTGLVVNNGGTVAGTVTVQRYLAADLNAGAGYRQFAAPVSNASVASLTTASFTPVVNPAYNTSATPATTMPFPTVYGYDQSRLASASNNLPAFDKGWLSPAALSDKLTVGQGYTVNLAAAQTLSVSGPLNDGDISQTLSRNVGATAADAGWALVGNPYPSPLDYSQVAAADRAGLDGAIYVSESRGQYTGTYRSYTNGVGGDPILALGQAFFARVSTGQTSGTLTFRNAQRMTTYADPVLHRRAAETRPLVQLTLQGSGSPLTDEAYVYFEPGATDGFDAQYDAVKLPNTTGLNVSASFGGQQLSIDGRGLLGSAQRVVPLAVGVPAAGSYALAATQLLNLAGVPVYLRDRQTGAVIDLRQQPAYPFTVANASALLTGRFELVFSPQQALATAPAALTQQVALYPNPATGSTSLELPATLSREAIAATLLDAVGRPVRALTLPAQGTQAHLLDLHALPAGVYALQLRTSAGTITKRLTIE